MKINLNLECSHPDELLKVILHLAKGGFVPTNAAEVLGPPPVPEMKPGPAVNEAPASEVQQEPVKPARRKRL